MPSWFYPVIIIEIIFIMIMSYLSKNIGTKKNETDKPISQYPYKKVKVMTETERKFYEQIKPSINENYILLSKVRLWDIIDTTAKEKQYIYTNKIKSKHIDFLITNKEAEPIIAIEIDDKSHEQAKRKDSDEFKNKAFEAAGIKLIRVKPQKVYDINKIINEIPLEQHDL